MTESAERDALVLACARHLSDVAVDPASHSPAETAALRDSLLVAEPPVDVLVAGLGGLVGVLGVRVAEATAERVAAAAHACCALARPRDVRLLGSAALHLCAGDADPARAVVRLVHSASTAQSLGNYPLAARAAGRAIDLADAGGSHDRVDLVDALLLLGVTGRRPEALERAAGLAESLATSGHEGVVRRRALTLRTRAGTGTRDPVADAAELLAEGRAGAAATALAGLLEEPGGPADGLLDGVRDVLVAYRADAPDPDAIRSGLEVVVGDLRAAQSQGFPPVHATAACRLLLHLILARPVRQQAHLVLELMDAAADAGLSRLPNEPHGWRGPAPTEPEVATASLVTRAAAQTGWQTAPEIVLGAAGGHALVLYCTHEGPDSATVLSVHVPPDGLGSVRESRIEGREHAALRRFGSADYLTVARSGPGTWTGLLASLLPATLAAAFAARSVDRLAVVPHGPFWSVPWAALRHEGAPLVRGTAVRVLPSLSFGASLRPAVERTGTIVLLHDPSVAIRAETYVSRGGVRWLPVTDVAEARSALAEPADALVVVGHGDGQGMGFGVGLPGGRVGSLELMGLPLPPALVVASCWSGRRSADPVPLGLATGCLLAGARTVVAGLWDLPAEATVSVALAVAEAIATGDDASEALRKTQDSWSGEVRLTGPGS